MNTTVNDTLHAEAVRSLRSYQTTGIYGFLTKALDRLRELRIEVTFGVKAGLPMATADLLEQLERKAEDPRWRRTAEAFVSRLVRESR